MMGIFFIILHCYYSFYFWYTNLINEFYYCHEYIIAFSSNFYYVLYLRVLGMSSAFQLADILVIGSPKITNVKFRNIGFNSYCVGTLLGDITD